jgi:hypothetical protein
MHLVAFRADLFVVSCLGAEHDALRGRGFAVGVPFDKGSQVTRHDLVVVSRVGLAVVFGLV